jgi:hypothetical protein
MRASDNEYNKNVMADSKSSITSPKSGHLDVLGISRRGATLATTDFAKTSYEEFEIIKAEWLFLRGRGGLLSFLFFFSLLIDNT